MSQVPNLGEGIVETDMPGMDEEFGRCMTCDCRYCGDRCHAATGTQYVVGIGYRTKEIAALWAEFGRTCRPSDEGWLDPAKPPKPAPISVAQVEKRLFELLRAKEVAESIGCDSDTLARFEAAIVDQSDILELAYARPNGQ